MAINTCAVCGFGMKPLAVGSYCPNDCDKKIANQAVGNWKSLKSYPQFMYQLLVPGDAIPNDATHGWSFSPDHSPTEETALLVMGYIAESWASASGGWSLIERGLGRVHDYNFLNLMVTKKTP